MKLFWAVAYALVTVPFIYAAVVLWGAPLLSHFGENLLFSLVLSAVTVFPLLLVADNAENLDTILFDYRYLSRRGVRARHISLGGIIGAWFGAFVIPLDWDRWWQRWPLPCIFGALIGGILGFIISCYKTIISRFTKPRKLQKVI